MANKPAPPKFIGPTRPLVSGDLEVLLAPVFVPKVLSTGKVRDSHHRVAELLAMGTAYATIAERTGYSYQRIAILATAPAMKELVAVKREIVDASFRDNVDDYFRTSFGNMMKAERQIADTLDEADEHGRTLPVRDLVAITSDRADRFGYPKRSTNLNLNADFAAMLDKAVARSKAIEPLEGD